MQNKPERSVISPSQNTESVNDVICDFCGSEQFNKIFDHTRYVRNDILKCINCDLVFLKRPKDKKGIINHYRNTYRAKNDFPIQTPLEHFNDPVTCRDSAERLKWIVSNFDRKGAKVLEIGSASGKMLQVMKDHGFDVMGIELTKDYVEFSRRSGLNVEDIPVEELNLDNHFDLIISFHCFEHLSDPGQAIAVVKRALKKGGIFMGEVPNQDDWRISIFDNQSVKYLHYDPDHNFYFNSKTLCNYFEKYELSVKAIETVERYGTLLQLKRLLSGHYDSSSVKEILDKDVYADSNSNVRLNQGYGDKEIEFDKILAKAINDRLLGNCLRWIVSKE